MPSWSSRQTSKPRAMTNVINKVRTDLREDGIPFTEAELRIELERAAAEARRQTAQS
jgi:hypothetical protein